MAWIEVHQALAQHPKLFNLSAALHEEPETTIGRLVLFWLWGLDVTRDGALRNVTPSIIARVMRWKGDDNDLYSALHNHGWIDESPDGTPSIHDWTDYAGRLMAERDRNRERQRKFRESRNAPSNAHITVTSQLRNAATVPNPTVPNHNKEPSKKETLPTCINRDAWEGFVAMRIKIRKPMTDHAKVLLLRKLERWHVEGFKVNELLEEAIINGWQGPVIKEGDNGRKPSPNIKPRATGYDPERYARSEVAAREERERTEELQRRGAEQSRRLQGL